MIVEPIEKDDDKPFVKITFTRKEAEILRELVNNDIEDLANSANEKLDLPRRSNDTFAYPLYEKLDEILG